jgi:thymidine phosphorylase
MIMFLPQEVIRKKRDGGVLDREEIAEFIRGVVDGSVGEGQIAAFAMATLLKGMEVEECVSLTLAMRDSGDVLAWDGLPGPVVDKHSTGGVGDLVSLVLGPLVAACGGYVPMISGRGLGHTGGTLDKLESIPGYNVAPGADVFRRVVEECGVAIIGQTGALAPADKKIYAVRDITATVESIDMIVASILSKKLAAGLGSLVMDVKCGNGAFMPTPDEAGNLARLLVRVANGAGLRTRALVTAMDQPLARTAGNALEVREAVDFLQGGEVCPALREVTMALGVEMLLVSGLAKDGGEAGERLGEALASGKAADCFGRMVAGLGGPVDFMEKAESYLPVAPLVREVRAPRGGFVCGVRTRDLGLAVVALGGGRRRAEDRVDPSVGLEFQKRPGDAVAEGEVVATVHAAGEEAAEAAVRRVLECFEIGDDEAEPYPAVLERILEQ